MNITFHHHSALSIHKVMFDIHKRFTSLSRKYFLSLYSKQSEVEKINKTAYLSTYKSIVFQNRVLKRSVSPSLEDNMLPP